MPPRSPSRLSAGASSGGSPRRRPSSGVLETQEIAVLARSLNTADADLSRLRSMLAALRERAVAARAA